MSHRSLAGRAVARGPIAALAVAFVCAAVPAGAARRSAPADPLLMTMCGDSILQGTSAARATETLVGRLARIRPSWFIRNYGVAGASVSGSPPFPPMQASAIVPLLGSVQIVLLGTNDFGAGIPLETFRSNYGRFLDGLSYLRPRIVCVTPIWRSDEAVPNEAGAVLDQYRTIIEEECGMRGFNAVDGRGLVPHDAQYYNLATSFGVALHPNSLGYRRFAVNLARRLDELFLIAAP